MNIYNRSWQLASSHEHERMSELSETRLKPSQADAIVGEFVTEIFDYDDKRQVTVYVPPVPPEAIVFAGDGQMSSQWGRFLETADVPPTMIVGGHRAAEETLRPSQTLKPALLSSPLKRTPSRFCAAAVS